MWQKGVAATSDLGVITTAATMASNSASITTEIISAVSKSKSSCYSHRRRSWMFSTDESKLKLYL